jgi:hypothetical protein
MSFPGAAGAVVRNVATAAQLQSAIRTSGANDEIVLARGSYAPVETLVVRHPLTLSGPRAGLGAVVGGWALSKGDLRHILSVEVGASLTIRDLTLSGAPSDGFIADVRGRMRLENATVATSDGSALVVEAGGTLSTLNVTVSDSAGFGLVVQPGGVATLSSTTVAGNAEGGIYNSPRSRVGIRNSIVVSDDPASRGDCQGPVQSSVASLDFDGTCAVQMSGDPLLGPLRQNGGPTPTRLPAPASLAVDAGVDCPTIDQRHAPRVAGRCDIGAVEAGSTPGAGPAAGAATISPTASGCRQLPGPRAGRVIRALTASGALPGPVGRRATLGLRLTARSGAWRGGGVYADPRARLRLRLDAPQSIALDRRRRTATFRTAGRDVRTRRETCVTVRVAQGRHGSVFVSTTTGYRRGARFAAGGARLSVARQVRSTSTLTRAGGTR